MYGYGLLGLSETGYRVCSCHLIYSKTILRIHLLLLSSFVVSDQDGELLVVDIMGTDGQGHEIPANWQHLMHRSKKISSIALSGGLKAQRAPAGGTGRDEASAVFRPQLVLIIAGQRGSYRALPHHASRCIRDAYPPT